MPLKTLNFKSSLEVLQGKNEFTEPSRVYGCVYFIHNINARKLDPRALKRVFIGYSPTQNGYKCYHPPSQRYFVCIDVTFRETGPYLSFAQTTF